MTAWAAFALGYAIGGIVGSLLMGFIYFGKD